MNKDTGEGLPSTHLRLLEIPFLAEGMAGTATRCRRSSEAWSWNSRSWMGLSESQLLVWGETFFGAELVDWGDFLGAFGAIFGAMRMSHAADSRKVSFLPIGLKSLFSLLPIGFHSQHGSVSMAPSIPSSSQLLPWSFF